MPRSQFVSNSTPPGHTSTMGGRLGPSKAANKRKAKAPTSSADKENRPGPASGSLKPLPEHHIQGWLSNFDLEAERYERERRKEIQTAATMVKMHARTQITALPVAVREATMEDFLRIAHGDIRAFSEKRPHSHLEKTHREWERAKRKRAWVSSDPAGSGNDDVNHHGAEPGPSVLSGSAVSPKVNKAKSVKKPPISRHATVKSAKSKSGSSSASGRSGPRSSMLVLRTQTGDEIDVEDASSGELADLLGLNTDAVSQLRAILQSRGAS